jgi:hypothetical protein
MTGIDRAEVRRERFGPRRRGKGTGRAKHEQRGDGMILSAVNFCDEGQKQTDRRCCSTIAGFCGSECRADSAFFLCHLLVWYGSRVPLTSKGGTWRVGEGGRGGGRGGGGMGAATEGVSG